MGLLRNILSPLQFLRWVEYLERMLLGVRHWHSAARIYMSSVPTRVEVGDQTVCTSLCKPQHNQPRAASTRQEQRSFGTPQYQGDVGVFGNTVRASLPENIRMPVYQHRYGAEGACFTDMSAEQRYFWFRTRALSSQKWFSILQLHLKEFWGLKNIHSIIRNVHFLQVAQFSAICYDGGLRDEVLGLNAQICECVYRVGAGSVNGFAKDNTHQNHLTLILA